MKIARCKQESVDAKAAGWFMPSGPTHTGKKVKWTSLSFELKKTHRRSRSPRQKSQNNSAVRIDRSPFSQRAAETTTQTPAKSGVGDCSSDMLLRSRKRRQGWRVKTSAQENFMQISHSDVI